MRRRIQLRAFSPSFRRFGCSRPDLDRRRRKRPPRLSPRPVPSPTSPPFSIRKSPIRPSARSGKRMPMRSRPPPRARHSENFISSAARPAPPSAAPRMRSPIARRRCRSAATTATTSAACSNSWRASIAQVGDYKSAEKVLQEMIAHFSNQQKGRLPGLFLRGAIGSLQVGDVPRAQNYVNRANAFLTESRTWSNPNVDRVRSSWERKCRGRAGAAE